MADILAFPNSADDMGMEFIDYIIDRFANYNMDVVLVAYDHDNKSVAAYHDDTLCPAALKEILAVSIDTI